MAEYQHGVVAAWQLIALGISRTGIETRLRSGLMTPLHPGVYVVGTRRPTRLGRWVAAVLAAGDGAVLSHRAAAALWGLIDRFEGVPVVTAPRKRSRPGVRVCRARLREDERDVRNLIPLTTPSRTILDLAPAQTADRLERMIDRAEHARLLEAAPLPLLLERYPRRPGTPLIRAVLKARLGLTLTRSELEDRFLAFVAARGLPAPQVNVAIRVGARAYEIDCLWSDRNLAIELDGFQTHGGRRAFRDDRIRDRRLRTIGIETLRVTPHDVGPGADDLAADLFAILA